MKRTIVALLATLPTHDPGVDQETVKRDMRQLGIRDDFSLAALVREARLAGAAIYVDHAFRICWTPTHDQLDRVEKAFNRMFEAE